MEQAGIILVSTAAAIELIVGSLFMAKILTPNPHYPWAMFSGAIFAIGGVLFIVAA